ncbi:DUF2330 domain-containing protein [Streptomyces sp. NPDC005526]|uniref:DUF2330 domain-containing protein n=1 Tax=Streptomyces sp. NPDC005526 TaxID=3156885 RepID=UPI0033A1BFB7
MEKLEVGAVGLLRRTGTRGRGRVLTVVLALLGVQLAWLVAPAYACGCGAMVTDPDRRIAVGREVSAVRWDGRQEQIVMRLTVTGNAGRAAWIMPVPHRATVRLGDPALFGQLAAASAPAHRTRHHFWPQRGDWPFDSGDRVGAASPGAVGAGGVGVVGRQRLGPFDVARLTATDPDALAGWLHSHGFTLPDRLDRALEPYVERRWEYVAIRLTPRNGSGSTALNGTLDPLHLTFAADAPVYPMRLSRLARSPQSLSLFVLAAHRMEPATTIGGNPWRVGFAGRLTTASGPLAELSRGAPYLTVVDQEFPLPARISGDHTLRRTGTDTPYREVVYADRLREVAGVPAWLLTTGGGAALALAAAALYAVRRSRRPVPPPPPVPTPPPIG